jgi:type IV secretory pathway VirD2 relaxase
MFMANCALVDSHQPSLEERDDAVDPRQQLLSGSNFSKKAGDERLWKLIVSPEFGDRADLKQLTRDLLARMEKDLGTPLQWVAAAHYNTEHPHVHMALRGIGAEGRSLHLSRDYIRQGIRRGAEDLCTRQLGYRTEFDAATAQRREVHEHRYTRAAVLLETPAVLESQQAQSLVLSQSRIAVAVLLMLR